MTESTSELERFVIVFHRIDDPSQAQKSTLFAAMSLMGVRLIDGTVPGNVLVEGREESVAALLEGSTEWTYTSVRQLIPTVSRPA